MQDIVYNVLIGRLAFFTVQNSTRDEFSEWFLYFYLDCKQAFETYYLLRCGAWDGCNDCTPESFRMALVWDQSDWHIDWCFVLNTTSWTFLFLRSFNWRSTCRFYEDIWIRIMSFLDAKSLLRLAVTNRQFCALAKDDVIWKSVFLRDIGNLVVDITPAFSWMRLYLAACGAR